MSSTVMTVMSYLRNQEKFSKAGKVQDVGMGGVELRLAVTGVRLHVGMANKRKS